MKVSIQKQSDKKRTPYRVRVDGITVSVHTEYEAKRVAEYTRKLLVLIGDE